jgi:hypothetical protein
MGQGARGGITVIAFAVDSTSSRYTFTIVSNSAWLGIVFFKQFHRIHPVIFYSLLNRDPHLNKFAYQVQNSSSPTCGLPAQAVSVSVSTKFVYRLALYPIFLYVTIQFRLSLEPVLTGSRALVEALLA